VPQGLGAAGDGRWRRRAKVSGCEARRQKHGGWDDRTAAQCREATTHEHGVGETSFRGDLIF
jgi:hypothetical protein